MLKMGKQIILVKHKVPYNSQFSVQEIFFFSLRHGGSSIYFYCFEV